MSEAFDPLALVAQAASSTKKKAGKKSSSPVLEITDKHTDDVEGFIAALEALKDAKAREKNATADKKLAEKIIMPAALKARREHLMETGAYVTTVKIGEGVSMGSSKKHSKIEVGDKEDLQEIFGDKYNKYFDTHTSIAFNDQSATNPEILKKIIEAIGAEQFGKVFDIEQTVVLKGYDSDQPPLVRDRDCDPEIAKIHDKAVAEGLIVPQKPAFRV